MDIMFLVAHAQLVQTPTVTHALELTNAQLVWQATQFSIMLVLHVTFKIVRLAKQLINAQLAHQDLLSILTLV
jgi:hypothetical protein